MPRASCDSMHADSPGTSLMKSSRQEIRWVRGVGEAERGLGAEDERGDTRREWCSTVPLWCWRGTEADRTSGRIDGRERARGVRRSGRRDAGGEPENAGDCCINHTHKQHYSLLLYWIGVEEGSSPTAAQQRRAAPSPAPSQGVYTLALLFIAFPSLHRGGRMEEGSKVSSLAQVPIVTDGDRLQRAAGLRGAETVIERGGDSKGEMERRRRCGQTNEVFCRRLETVEEGARAGVYWTTAAPTPGLRMPNVHADILKLKREDLLKLKRAAPAEKNTRARLPPDSRSMRSMCWDTGGTAHSLRTRAISQRRARSPALWLYLSDPAVYGSALLHLVETCHPGPPTLGRLDLDAEPSGFATTYTLTISATTTPPRTAYRLVALGLCIALRSDLQLPVFPNCPTKRHPPTRRQTETGSIVITPFPGAVPTKPGSATVSFFGHVPVVPVILDTASGESSKLYWKPRSPDFGLALFPNSSALVG
ncbi:hypothetical protein DFH06DRAFT_1332033 [Mycena polygramma]|nr:hypothetical protein DFH06DRAFT_1332033 [Mycena polygramma]